MEKKDAMERIRPAVNARLSGLQGDPFLARRVMTQATEEKKGKRKASLGLVIAVVLVLATVTALAVGTLSRAIKIKQADVGAMRGCVSTGDTIYLITGNGLSRWKPGDETPEIIVSADEMTECGIAGNALLYWDGVSVGLVDVQHQSLWKLAENGPVLLCSDDGTEIELPQHRYKQAVYQDGSLFLLADSTKGIIPEGILFRVNLLTGEGEQLPVSAKQVDEICAYEPGKLLVLVSDVSEQTESLLVLDTRTGSVIETLFAGRIQQIQGIAYGQGGLYALADGFLSRWNGDDWTALSASSPGFLSDCFAVVDGGYVSLSYDEMQYLPFETETSQQSLTIWGYPSTDNGDSTFQEEYGVTVARRRDPALTAAQVRQAIEAGDTTDLFYVWLDAELMDMFCDGWIAPLTASNVLMDDAQAVTPVLREGLMLDGQLYAVPSLLTICVWQGEDMLPATYEELLAGNFSIAQDNAEMNWSMETHVRYLLETFIAECARDGKELELNDEAFCSALKALKNLNLSGKMEEMSETSIRSGCVVDLGGSLSSADTVTYGFSGETLQTDDPQWRLPLPVSADSKPSIPVRMAVYVLNPNARNPEAAVAYLEFIVAHRTAGNEGLLKPEEAAPVLSPSAEEMIHWIDESQRAYDGEQGMPTDEDALQARINAVCAAADSWAITENRLQQYRQILLPCLDLRLTPLLSPSSKGEGGTYSLLLQKTLSYVEGKGTLEECIEEMRAIVTE